jgi:DNA polymerase (family 10)
LRRQADEIARVQEQVDIRLLHGTEADILNRYRMSADETTRRVARALRHPLFEIWGHALGRYVLSRPPFECDMDQVLDAAAQSRVAIEINGDPHRLDLAPPWIREARERGIPFVISTDAHSTRGLENMRWGVDMARRGWLAKRDVLNTRGASEFAAAVRP